MNTTGKVIAIGNLKGGVGKSTLAVNVASALATRGLPTVILDTDPQQTALACTRGRRLPCAVESLPIRQLSAVGEWMDGLGGARDRFARVVIDLPAVLSPALAAAFLAADAILIPTSFSPVDLQATRRTVRHAKIAAAERAARPPLILAVPMLVRRNWMSKPEVPAPRHRALEVPVADPVGYDPAFGEAFEQSDWIGGYAPRSRAHRELLTVVDRVEAGLAGHPTGAGPATRPQVRPDQTPQRRPAESLAFTPARA
jgi:chromosome partitioning protein